VVGGTDLASAQIWVSIKLTYKEKSVVTIDTIYLIQEERPVHIGYQGVQVLQNQKTWSFCPCSFEDSLDTRFIASPIWIISLRSKGKRDVLWKDLT
jgi:hypothetical protein